MAPCAVVVGSAGVMGEVIPVRDAPAGCDTDLLTRARARLSCNSSQLDVSGTRGPVGGQVVISDADGGERLGSFPVADKQGRFAGSVSLTSPPSALALSVEVAEASWMLDEPLAVTVDDDCEGDDEEEDDEDDHGEARRDRRRGD